MSSVGFDSPGLPDFIRQSFEVSTATNDDQTLVYGHENIVNNLCRAPEGAISFRVGKGPPFRLDTIPRFLVGIPKLLMEIKNVFSDSLSSHDIEKIASLLEEGHFQRDTSTAERDYSGMALRVFFFVGHYFSRAASHVKEFFGAPVAHTETPIFEKGHGGRRTSSIPFHC